MRTPGGRGPRAAAACTPKMPIVQNIRRGHYELGINADRHTRLTAAFTELTLTI